jgi:hypothetical protein
MAEFTVSCEEADSCSFDTSTAYAAALKFAKKMLSDHPEDDDEFDISVLEHATGKAISYTLRAQVTVHWTATRNKDDDGAA